MRPFAILVAICSVWKNARDDANCDVSCGRSAPFGQCRSDARCGFGLDVALAESVFCPAGSSTPSTVTAGYYSSGIGDPKFPKQTRDQERECNPPYWCPGGSGSTDGKKNDGKKKLVLQSETVSLTRDFLSSTQKLEQQVDKLRAENDALTSIES